MRIPLSRLAFAAACLAGLLSSILMGFGPAAPAQAESTLSGLDVVSPPVAAGNIAVVIVLSTSHELELTGVDPASGSVVWRRPYGASDVTLGVPLAPAIADGTVLDASPASKPTDPAVTLSGIDAATGATEWTVPSAVVLSDNPVACVGNQDFCLMGYNPDGSSDMVIVDAATGHPVTQLSGLDREIGPNLYESDAKTPTFEQLTSAGTIGWTSTASSIFGSGYDPAQGWNILPFGSLNVGSIGGPITGDRMNMANNKTVGFSIASGATAWSISGAYMCMGALQFLSTQVTCQFSGSFQEPKKYGVYPSMKGVTLKLAGFNPTTGAIDWTQPVGGVTAMTFGNGLRFADGTHLAVSLLDGKSVLLNTTTGANAPLQGGAILWCQKLPLYKVPALKGTEGGGLRASTPLYFPCTPDGRPSSRLPATFPSTIGAIVNGVFVWPSTAGLRSHTVGVRRSSV